MRADRPESLCLCSLSLQPKELDPSAVLPLDCLLAFVFFDANWCGYLHRRDLERVLLTLGIRLSAEQVVLSHLSFWRALPELLLASGPPPPPQASVWPVGALLCFP